MKRPLMSREALIRLDSTAALSGRKHRKAKTLNDLRAPFVVIAASGLWEGRRIQEGRAEVSIVPGEGRYLRFK